MYCHVNKLIGISLGTTQKQNENEKLRTDIIVQNTDNVQQTNNAQQTVVQ